MSQLVEYIEPNERSAPVEILVQFLTSVMTKDYKMALTLCSEILSYEPNNTTAQEFYPLIAQKLQLIENESESSESDSTSDSESCEDKKSIKFSSETSESELSSDESTKDYRSVNSKEIGEKPQRGKNGTFNASNKGKCCSKSKEKLNKVSVTSGRTAKTIKDNDKLRRTCKEGRVKAKVNAEENQKNSVNIPKEQFTVFGEKLQEPPC